MSSKQNYQNTGLGLSAPCHIPAYINMCTEKRNFMNEDMLRVGVITSTHGIKGEVKVFPTTDDPARFKKLKECVIAGKRGNINVTVQSVKFFKLTDVIETGANNVYEVTAPGGRVYYLPVIDECILAHDLDNKTVTVHVLKGLLDIN